MASSVGSGFRLIPTTSRCKHTSARYTYGRPLISAVSECGSASAARDGWPQHAFSRFVFSRPASTVWSPPPTPLFASVIGRCWNQSYRFVTASADPNRAQRRHSLTPSPDPNRAQRRHSLTPSPDPNLRTAPPLPEPASLLPASVPPATSLAPSDVRCVLETIPKPRGRRLGFGMAPEEAEAVLETI
jgi:hypothetical protein